MTSHKINPSLYQKVLVVDSSSRSSGSSDNFQINLVIPPNNHFNKISLLEADIPKGYYMIDSQVIFNYTDPSGTVPVYFPTSNITGRNYSATQLATELKATLDQGGTDTTSGQTYTVTFQSYTGKFLIEASAGTFSFTIPATNADYTSLAKYLGFETATAYSSSTSTPTTDLLSAKRGNLQRHDVIYLNTSLANNSGDSRIGEFYPNSTSTLDVIPFKTPDAFVFSRALANNNVNQATFSLTDKDNNTISLNGLNWRATLSLFMTSPSPI